MNNLKLASGDGKDASLSNVSTDEEKIGKEKMEVAAPCDTFTLDEVNKVQRDQKESAKIMQRSEVTSKIIDDHETKLKERVEQCKNLIASLKLELNEEKTKLEKQTHAAQRFTKYDPASKITKTKQNDINFLTDLSNSANLISTSIDSKLDCDENIMEYEKQLQRYQNTLNMAQIEKKNAIRKQMLAKAYRLKLLEVENQCNIELLRVKQSLQCLEPLQMIVEKWKDTSEDKLYDINNFELIPRYPELYGNSANDLVTNESNVKELDPKTPINSVEPSNFD